MSGTEARRRSAMGQLLPRHIVQRRQYGERRYARHLSQPELNRRIRDVFLNLMDLTPDGKISVGPIDAEFEIWSEKWVHVLEEMQLRHGPFPAGFTRDIWSVAIPNFASELGRKAAAAMAPLGLKRDEVFIKFGNRQYMTALYESGSLRIQPASYFANRNHNAAVRDDELTRMMSMALSGDDVRKLVINPQDLPQDVPEQRVDIEFRFATDYYLYCLTTSVKPRLFADFQAEACVIIKDRAAFTRMLRTKAVAEHLPQESMAAGPAQYIDPLLPQSANLLVPLCKHFSYTYQREHRFCWLPAMATTRLEHIDVEVGSLKEIAELIVL